MLRRKMRRKNTQEIAFFTRAWIRHVLGFSTQGLRSFYQELLNVATKILAACGPNRGQQPWPSNCPCAVWRHASGVTLPQPRKANPIVFRKSSGRSASSFTSSKGFAGFYLLVFLVAAILDGTRQTGR